jgi:hypothetical protein
MTKNPSFSILVNSTDAYSDCWVPFFALLNENLDFSGIPIFLHSESLDFTFPGITMINSRYSNAVTAWSERLRIALNRIDTPYVVYLQEDFFMFEPVKVDLLITFIKSMEESKARHILLIAPPDREDLERPFFIRYNLFRMAPYATHRLCLQAGIWHVPTLRNLLKQRETPWDLERYGTIRSYFREDLFLAHNPPDRHRRYDGCVFPYVPTGVFRGRWDLSVVEELLRRNRIEVDFTIRGYQEETPPRRWWRWRMRRLLFHLASIPARLLRAVGSITPEP